MRFYPRMVRLQSRMRDPDRDHRHDRFAVALPARGVAWCGWASTRRMQAPDLEFHYRAIASERVLP